jgi:hypothetical protein
MKARKEMNMSQPANPNMPQPANPNAQPTNLPTNKTVAATGGSAVGAAVATILLYLIDPKSELPQAVQVAVTTLMTAIVTFIAGYWTPPGATEGVIRTAEGQVVMGR